MNTDAVMKDEMQDTVAQVRTTGGQPKTRPGTTSRTIPGEVAHALPEAGPRRLRGDESFPKLDR